MGKRSIPAFPVDNRNVFRSRFDVDLNFSFQLNARIEWLGEGEGDLTFAVVDNASQYVLLAICVGKAVNDLTGITASGIYIS